MPHAFPISIRRRWTQGASWFRHELEGGCWSPRWLRTIRDPPCIDIIPASRKGHRPTPDSSDPDRSVSRKKLRFLTASKPRPRSCAAALGRRTSAASWCCSWITSDAIESKAGPFDADAICPMDARTDSGRGRCRMAGRVAIPLPFQAADAPWLRSTTDFDRRTNTHGNSAFHLALLPTNFPAKLGRRRPQPEMPKSQSAQGCRPAQWPLPHRRPIR
jgi:hypothetical protein